MSVAPWQVQVLTSAARGWSKLPGELRSQVETEICRDPFHDDAKPRCRKHLKGKIRDVDCECNREYRDLDNGRRIIYRVNKRKRVLAIWYVGPHQKEKARRGSGRG